MSAFSARGPWIVASAAAASHAVAGALSCAMSPSTFRSSARLPAVARGEADAMAGEAALDAPRAAAEGATGGRFTSTGAGPPIRKKAAAPPTRISTAPTSISDDEDDASVAGRVVPQFGQVATTVLTTLYWHDGQIRALMFDLATAKRPQTYHRCYPSRSERSPCARSPA